MQDFRSRTSIPEAAVHFYEYSDGTEEGKAFEHCPPGMAHPGRCTNETWFLYIYLLYLYAVAPPISSRWHRCFTSSSLYSHNVRLNGLGVGWEDCRQVTT